MINTKQVIVVRKDLNMRKGKIAAQAAHASMAAILKLGKPNKHVSIDTDTGAARVDANLLIPLTDPAVRSWLENSFTKICVYVNSEQELLDIVTKATELNILNALITDNGLTEFNGVRTNTCCAIGPGYSDTIDQVTKGLPLL